MTYYPHPSQVRARILAALPSIQDEFAAADLPFLVLAAEKADELNDEPGWSEYQMHAHARRLIAEGLLARRREGLRYYYRVAGDQK